MPPQERREWTVWVCDQCGERLNQYGLEPAKGWPPRLTHVSPDCREEFQPKEISVVPLSDLQAAEARLEEAEAKLEEIARLAHEADVACRELAWWTKPVAPPDDDMQKSRHALRRLRTALATAPQEGEADEMPKWIEVEPSEGIMGRRPERPQEGEQKTSEDSRAIKPESRSCEAGYDKGEPAIRPTAALRSSGESSGPREGRGRLALLAAAALDTLDELFSEGELDDDSNPPQTSLYNLADAALDDGEHFDQQIAERADYADYTEGGRFQQQLALKGGGSEDG